MSSAQHVLALLKSHIEGDEDQFLAVAMQVAAREARQGHTKFALAVRELVDAAKIKRASILSGASPLRAPSARHPVVPVVRPSGELATLLSATFPETRLDEMVLPASTRERLNRVLLEQRQQENLRSHGLQPRRRLLLIGTPGSGKTMTASALAGELRLPLLAIRLDGVITRYMGESAAKLRLIFDAMSTTHGVYLFDEFDAIGSRRSATNDVGEIRRVLNSFLQFLEQDVSSSVIVAATNHPEMLDTALFRRFDDVIEYAPPAPDTTLALLRNRLISFDLKTVDWQSVIAEAEGLSQAEVVRAADESAKAAVLSGHKRITTRDLASALNERRRAPSRKT
jgi:SpoVK/Ycf46/Vps4 family AAA+-type ATPase